MDIKMPKIAPEGHNLIIIFAIITLILFFISGVLGIIGVILTVWCISFFRDPERITPKSFSLVIAPADGKIIHIEKVIPPEEIGIVSPMLKISIFMNVFNVHINRAPCDGKIKRIMYNAGKFVNASLDKASLHNERQSFIMENMKGDTVVFVQIAGLIARRIVKFIDEDTIVKAGEKVGLIKFGSRVDVYLPENVVPLVEVGQTTIAGETILADFDFTGVRLNYGALNRVK
ncbi:Phosphatidylserine decarboxylase [Candidatus Hepatincolaceae symbiont of Richtersius coronifer]